MNPFELSLNVIEELVREHGTPIYVVNRRKIRENFQRLDTGLPAVKFYYAVKANPCPEILETLVTAGAGFDVASKGEILAAVAAGANPREDLIFADTVKDPKQIAYAHSIGLDDFTFDNRSEITQIARHAPGSKVHLRIIVSNEGSVAHLSHKFGADLAEAVPLLLAAREQGLVPHGISFHVGSQCLDANRYVEALDTTRKIFTEAAGVGIELKSIDIGGGFPVRYIDEEIDLEDMCGRIRDHYEQLFGREGLTGRNDGPPCELVAEPGRAIVGDAAILVTKVISESVREGRNWLYFDDGTYGSFMEVLLYNMNFPWRTNTKGPLKQYVLAGPTCDSIDVFSRDAKGEVCTVELPEMHLDDLLIVGSMGAYTYSESTRFNGFEPPKFVFVD
ncbi:MAG: type III PLP-dependent enzyme [Gemmatimonadales bacterium]|nr:type III PLP-dependent enzyme [Gemmatimonadales bacterium]